MRQYHKLLREISTNGTLKEAARPGMPGTIALFGIQERFDLSKSFPLVTTKKLSFRNILTELMWFMKGDTNINYLIENKCNIWVDDTYRGYLNKIDKDVVKIEPLSKEEFIQKLLLDEDFSDEYGDLGPTYGYQWRSFGGDTDQLAKVIRSLKNAPAGRRHIITAWDPNVVDSLILPPCHPFIQFDATKLTVEERVEIYSKGPGLRRMLGQDFYGEDFFDESTEDLPEPIRTEYSQEDIDYLNLQNVPQYKLSCQFYMRSVDMFLGAPYNIASYAFLTSIIAKIVGMVPGQLVFTAGDAHIYENHIVETQQILERDTEAFAPPQLALSGVFDEVESFYKDGEFELDRFLKELDEDLYRYVRIINYNAYPAIKAELSVGI